MNLIHESKKGLTMLGRFSRFTRWIARREKGTFSSIEAFTNRPDVSATEWDILTKVQAFSMTSEARLLAVIDAVRYLVKFQVPGDLVECGVWRGGSSMAAALALKEVGDTSRNLYLYDTFEGMTPPTGKDLSYDGVKASELLKATPVGTGIWCLAGLEEVRANLTTTGYPQERIQYIQGRVEDTIPKTIPEKIALLRLDTDWYESTKHELEHLYPRLVRGGILIIDDFGHWQGSRKATEEYFDNGTDPIYFQRLDYTGRLAVKI